MLRSIGVKCCVCYVVDDNYLFPTLLSAIQARENLDHSIADILIVCISNSPDKSEIVRLIAKGYGIILTVVPNSAIDNMHPMYGRLFIDQIIPKKYVRVIYLDGDTQIRGSLLPLVEANIESKRFLAVRDPSCMFARYSSALMAQTVRDRNSAGIVKSYDDYFNTGVLVFDRVIWPELSRATLDAVKANSGRFKYGDQDPMNLAVGEKCIYISNKWNFPGFFIGSVLEQQVNPVIYHFMSNPRPWTHAVSPWGAAWQEPYTELLRLHKSLAPYIPRTTLSLRVKYYLQQTLKMLTEYGPVGRTFETAPDLEL